MSQESRDARLGLTGLTPEQRAKRLSELDKHHAKVNAEAKAKQAEAWAHKEAKMKMGKEIQVINPNEPLPPKQENFGTQEEFEEAQGRWRWTVGRNRALRKQALEGSQQKSKLTDDK